MCLPPLGCVIPRESPAFRRHADVEDTFLRFAISLSAAHGSPFDLARAVTDSLHYEFFGDFTLHGLQTTLNSCCADRSVPAVDRNQVLFDTMVVLGGRNYHLTCLARCEAE